MRRSSLFTLVAVFLHAAVLAAQSSPTVSTPTVSQTTPDACAAVSSSAVSYVSASPEATFIELKPSELYSCLQSVPNDIDKDTKQIAWLQDILQFQSTLAYLKAPPPSYPLPAVDLVGELNNISTFVANEVYSNEYDIELDIYNVINSAYDGHLKFMPYLPGTFNYVRTSQLVSVSPDGIQPPKIFLLSDLLAPTNGSFTPSAVTRIDGEDVKDLTRYGSGMQDLDALYNSALTSPAIWGYNGGYGTLKIGPFTQHRDTTLYTFENGSTTEDTATAQLDSLQAKSFPGSGLELFDLITSTVTNTSASSSSASPTSSSLPSSTPLGSTYPSPIVQHSENFISGFFLNETENNDVAVLNAASFFVHGPSDRDEFLQKSAVFLAKCRSAGKTRLIVDVRNNPGGMVILGFALFSQLFPDIIPYSGIRFRASDATNEIGQIASANLTQSIDEIIPNGFEFAYQDLLQTPNGLNYTSWQQLYGPVQQHGDLYSQLAAWRFGSPDYYSSLSHLYYDGASIPPQVFASADITLLTDGQCSSTCAIFANLMINQGHVKTVTMGGRPNNQPMAIIGGVQGAQVEEADFLQLAASAAIEAQAEAKGNSSVEASRTQKLLGSLALPPPIAAAPSGVSVNLLDNIAENDTSVTPLQFTGGIASNCRTYYTLPDFVNSANTWARVARGGKAGGSGLCINGTLTNTTVSLGNSSGSNSTPPGGSNGNNALTFQGDASNTQFSKLGCSILVITVGLFSTLIL